eukprot:8804004-Pyramimonas_sp.AAC.1
MWTSGGRVLTASRHRMSGDDGKREAATRQKRSKRSSEKREEQRKGSLFLLLLLLLLLPEDPHSTIYDYSRGSESVQLHFQALLKHQGIAQDGERDEETRGAARR